jgi:hypothetical protein
MHSRSRALLEKPLIVQPRRTSQHLMEPEGSLPCSQEPSTGPYPEPDQFNQYYSVVSLLISILKYFVTRFFLRGGVFYPHVQPSSWRPTPCRLSATAYLLYSQLPSIRIPRTRHAVVTRDPPNMAPRRLTCTCTSEN